MILESEKKIDTRVIVKKAIKLLLYPGKRKRIVAPGKECIVSLEGRKNNP